MTARLYCATDVHGRPCQFDADHAGDCRPIAAVIDWVPVPRQPMAEVDDGLWIGSSIVDIDPHAFDAVLTLHSSLPPAPAPIFEKRWHIRDAELPDLDGLSAATGFVFNQWAMQDRRVLIRCVAGLNRSGLVAANVLIADCFDPVEAIAMVRRARGPYALSNPRFEDYLLSQGSLSDFI
jgi:hypothetical protein